MPQQKIFITKTDYQRLQNLLLSDFTQAIGNKPYLSGLHAELAVAHIVESEEIPADIVTMNSTVRCGIWKLMNWKLTLSCIPRMRISKRGNSRFSLPSVPQSWDIASAISYAVGL